MPINKKWNIEKIISSVKKYKETDIFRDSTNYKEYRFTDEMGVETKKVIRIKGQPALNRIQFFIQYSN